VAFKARQLDAVSRYYTTGERLVYKVVLLNEGGGYDNSTGYFTAPRSGTYLFTAQVCSGDGTLAVVNIMANNIPVGTVIHEDATGSWVDCGSGSGIAILSKGQRAWVQTTHSYTSTLGNSLTSWNSFTGVLI